MPQKRHVVMLYDVEDWAFCNIARNVSRNVDCYDFSLYAKADWFKGPLADEIVLKADVIVFLWRFDVLNFLRSLSQKGSARMLSPQRPAITTVVYDHLHQDFDDPSFPGDPYQYSDLVCASSRKLADIYNANDRLPDIQAVVPDGTNLDRFTPNLDPKPRTADLSIGWVGNSAWGQKFGVDLKGRHGVFDKALDMLSQRGLKFERRLADRAETRVPFDEMPEFYRTLDVLVCTSAIEGTPNPVLEAIASGAAVVSTDVGIVPEFFGPLQSQFIIARAAEPFADALAKLIKDRPLHASLRQENIARRHLLSWTSRTQLWTDVFDRAILHRDTQPNAASDAIEKSYKSGEFIKNTVDI